MNVQERYAAAKEEYAKIGVDTDAAIAKLKTIPGISALLAGGRRDRI